MSQFVQEHRASGDVASSRAFGRPASGPGPEAVGAELCALQEDVRALMRTVTETCTLMKRQITKSDDVMDRMELTIKKIDESITTANCNTDMLTQAINRLIEALDAKRA